MIGLVLAIIFSNSAFADLGQRTEAAAKLFVVMDMDKQIAGGFEAMLPTVNQVATNLQLDAQETEELKSIYRDWFFKDIDQENLKNQIVDLYADTFTLDELQNITEFFQTPTGKKLAAKSPELAKLGAQFGMEAAQAKQQELMQRLMPFIEKHQPQPQQ
ncbi:DUF2059 domain-containing protein [Vibrio sonorensis]|uniref:DUF2059 domain-containing protein n=1 Tax=Vibrio sonorensis TaxID=1004316 RepID=UPI001FDECB33|nr:DUF2059 domain-containing protein [Vibrio sonorensis]